ncbi:copper transporter [Cyathus striatus]|nr:copper transporter [Cyathus striatus]
MDHGGHEGHDMPMPSVKCSMNMLWNTDIIDTCIVFRSWHISSTTAFIFSCIAIVALGVFYEYLRTFSRKVDVHIASTLRAQSKGKSRSGDRSGRSTPVEGEYEEAMGLLSGTLMKASLTGTPVPTTYRALRAGLYGATVFLSFFLMLVFMTYNAYLITAVVIGAALGNYIFGATINIDTLDGGKGMACH